VRFSFTATGNDEAGASLRPRLHLGHGRRMATRNERLKWFRRQLMRTVLTASPIRSRLPTRLTAYRVAAESGAGSSHTILQVAKACVVVSYDGAMCAAPNRCPAPCCVAPHSSAVHLVSEGGREFGANLPFVGRRATTRAQKHRWHNNMSITP
jgi:hypothetical protein